MGVDSLNWTEALPIIVPGIRSGVKEDLGCSSSELVLETFLRLLGEMVTGWKSNLLLTSLASIIT